MTSALLKDIGKSTHIWAAANSVSCSYQESCASTNDWAKTESLGSDFHLYLTNHQSEGRGRGSNQWMDSGEGEFLLSSWCFETQNPPQHITGPLFGLAIFTALRQLWPSLEWSVKAPNDIYLCDKKVGGLLIETIQQGGTSRLIVGFGLNVLSAPDLDLASFIASDSGTGTDISEEKWSEFLNELLKSLRSAVSACQKSELSNEHRENLVEALNLNPLRPGLVLEITGNGDIVMEKQTLHWTDL